MNHELASFDAELAAKPQIVVGTKLDVTEARERFETARVGFAALGIELTGISAVAGVGIPALLTRIAAAVRLARAERVAVDGPEARAGERGDDHTRQPEQS